MSLERSERGLVGGDVRCAFPFGRSWRETLRSVAGGYASRVVVVGLLASAFFAIDQVSKLAATAFPPDHFVKNSTPGLQIWAALVPICVVALLPSRWLLLCGGLLVGGALGNAVDARFWPGGVPDFIDAPYPFTSPSIWNFADAFIDVGAAGFIVALVVITLRRLGYETRVAKARLDG